jgi:lipoprotein NlpI
MLPPNSSENPPPLSPIGLSLQSEDKRDRFRHLKRLGLVLALIAAALRLAKLIPESASHREIATATAARQNRDLASAIQHYTTAINSGQLTRNQLAAALRDRGSTYLQDRQYQKALTDLDQALAIIPGDGIALAGRGTAYSLLGDYFKAKSDFAGALNTQSKQPGLMSSIFAGSGQNDMFTAQYDEASIEFHQALQALPNTAACAEPRAQMQIASGQAEFLAGHYDLAESSLRNASDQNPKNSYAVLWLNLALSREAKDGATELSERAKNLDLEVWPGPIVQLYLGKENAAFVADAVVKENARTRRDQECEADFYRGELALTSNDKAEAQKLFHRASDECDRSFIEYAGANTEMARLDREH